MLAEFHLNLFQMLTNCWNYVGKSKFKVCFIAAIWGFLTGLERAVIIPTLWLYFSKVFSPSNAEDYYGWTLAAFNFAILLCDPLFGYLAFVGVRVKTLLVISNQLGIIGNIVYFIASHPWMVLFGRFLAGAGAGCEVPLYADMVRVTSTQERTSYIVTLLLFRQFGLIIGPACTLLMRDIKLKIGQVSIDIYNGPGLLLAILWGCHTILVLLIYPRLKNEKVKINKREMTPLLNSMPTESANDHRVSYCSDIIDSQLKQKPVDLPSPTTRERITNFFSPVNYRDYFKYSILANLVIIFSSYFSLMGLECVLPPMAWEYFNWSEIEVSWVYLGCGLSVILVYVILRLISSRGVEDRTLLLAGLVLLTISYLWLSICLSIIDKNQPNLFIGLIVIGIGFHVLGQPFCISISESLYTKQVSLGDQDRAQSILRMVINIALLIGPFVGGSMKKHANIVFILLLISIVISLVLLVVKFRNFTTEDIPEE